MLSKSFETVNVLDDGNGTTSNLDFIENKNDTDIDHDTNPGRQLTDKSEVAGRNKLRLLLIDINLQTESLQFSQENLK